MRGSTNVVPGEAITPEESQRCAPLGLTWRTDSVWRGCVSQKKGRGMIRDRRTCSGGMTQDIKTPVDLSHVQSNSNPAYQSNATIRTWTCAKVSNMIISAGVNLTSVPTCPNNMSCVGSFLLSPANRPLSNKHCNHHTRSHPHDSRTFAIFVPGDRC
ncbi:hypothetical protein BS50DRAFT_571096 [Corynespora cassiicola Philippines]|uniref:Uncharacterized protein n=1 Tax=Corynespora cassiicola Philippines TaxID=1448308 RepID=A0A2T2NWG3_CORCC|nr:hypothetical protein BS50DRAFT_571096 [Corynespora cassiicola Philippines]